MNEWWMLPPPRLDARSLVAFRRLLGLYFVWDVYSRISLGKYDLAWYTNDDNGYLDVYDTPHTSTLHRLWFVRGSSDAVQLAMFVIVALCSCAFAISNHWSSFSGSFKLLYWILIVAQQNRNMHVHDGSDTFGRHLLFWCIFLPLHNNNNNKRSCTTTVTTYSTLPAYALVIQIAFMYWGTVASRTIDLFSLDKLYKDCEWMPPKLTAVHYALSGSFAVRTNVLTRLVQTTPRLSKTLTAAAMLIETLAPLGCLVWVRYRMFFAGLLLLLHFGLLLTVRLPHWQLLGMLTTVVWVPSHVWNRILLSDSQPKRQTHIRYNNAPILSKAIQVFFFGYMLYNFAGERQWIPKHDGGDIGEGLRLSQYWVMYKTVDHNAHTTSLTGVTVDGHPYDIFQYLRTGQRADTSDRFWSESYPSARWERALHTWASTNDQRRAKRFCQALCVLLPDLAAVALQFVHYRIAPPGSKARFLDAPSYPKDIVVNVSCKKE